MVIPLVISYLLGSIPVGYLIVSATTGSDVRQTGSGGTGATNVSRRAGTGAGVVTLILDALKGAAAVLIASIFFTGVDSAWWIGAAGLIAILGHIFPIWLGFRGGKGVATGVGVFAVLTPFAVFCSAVVFVGIFTVTRYVSLASITAALMMPVFVLIYGLFEPSLDMIPNLVIALLGAILIVLAHSANIARLLSGTESKFGQSQ
ncbi:MAG TPA: glycerol-3-phosphate 1-O-acyltransferase PlsY [Pyrinomonadaceae bacterium]|jgi:acyl-phosphate glycerol 3-phosphate acyltransferase|nr:glycerol-3-phosphate 1-O-acyltransferase PlsY [Pyrinomonadaceae bacterium]